MYPRRLGGRDAGRAVSNAFRASRFSCGLLPGFGAFGDFFAFPLSLPFPLSAMMLLHSPRWPDVLSRGPLAIRFSHSPRASNYARPPGSPCLVSFFSIVDGRDTGSP